MPKTPYTRAGATVPITDGGTGAEDAATARTNLGAGDLTVAAHATTDHSGILGVSSPIAPKGPNQCIWLPDTVIGPPALADLLLPSHPAYTKPEILSGLATPGQEAGNDPEGPVATYTNDRWELKFPAQTAYMRSTWLPKVVIKHALIDNDPFGGAGETFLVFQVGQTTLQFVSFTFRFQPGPAGVVSIPWQMNVVPGPGGTADLGITSADTDGMVGKVLYFVVDWISATELKIDVLDVNLAVLYTETILGAGVPVFGFGSTAFIKIGTLGGGGAGSNYGVYSVALSYGP